MPPRAEQEQHPSRASWFLVAIAWMLVGIPLGWGIYITLLKSLVLFR